MTDDWEAQYGLNTNSAADAFTDLDGDGYVNLYEYLWDAIPTNPLSIALEAFPIAAAGAHSLYARDDAQA